MPNQDIDEIKKQIQEIHTALVGDLKQEGLVNRVATIEKRHNNMTWWIRSTSIAIIGILGKMFHVGST